MACTTFPACSTDIIGIVLSSIGKSTKNERYGDSTSGLRSNMLSCQTHRVLGAYRRARAFSHNSSSSFRMDLYHDCIEKSRRDESVVSVAMVRKPAHTSTMMFEEAALELQHPAERTPTLLLVRLHRKSRLFPDCYYHHRCKHFALFYDTGEDYNCGSPLRFIGAELLSSYEPGKDYSPRAKLPPSWRRDLGVTFPIDCCTWDYSDWTTGFPRVPPPERSQLHRLARRIEESM